MPMPPHSSEPPSIASPCRISNLFLRTVNPQVAQPYEFSAFFSVSLRLCVKGLQTLAP